LFMKRYQTLLFVVLCLPLVQLTFAQTSSETASALPRLVRFGGTVEDLNGKPVTGVAGITFKLYSEQTGGAPLWMETQNVTADGIGHYSALLGVTQSGGLPSELFVTEQARWVGVQVQGQPEQPRVLLVSAPYALKAGDAETIGGLPPSAFVLAAPSAAATGSVAGPVAQAAGNSSATATDVTTTGGTEYYLPFFSGASSIVDSEAYQAATGIGIRGTLTLPAIAAATACAGSNSEPLDLIASAFNGGTGTAVSQTFQLKAEPVNNDFAAASGVLSLLFGSGTAAPAETGLQIASNGLIKFAASQTFPGTGTGNGTVTSVGSGAGLTGGPITSSGTLTIDPTVVPLLPANNTFAANQTVNGNVTATNLTAAQTGVRWRRQRHDRF
jgi:trimeric autotransporter adhesin